MTIQVFWRKLITRRSAPIIVAGAFALSFTACGGHIYSSTQTQSPLSCAQLAGKTVPAAAIGLPSTGAVVTAATIVPASGTGAPAIGEYCKVTGNIHSVDPVAPQITFQIDMPTIWNSKVMMFGGGGYDGTVRAPEGNVPVGPVDQPVPLGRGYAVFASDSGHQASALGTEDGSFGANDEALGNFVGDALKKTRDAAVYLINARYAVKGPTKAYFAGGSSGGREALAVVQRWPQDWDGVIVLYPAWAAASLDLQFGRITRALASPGAYLDRAKRKVLYDNVMAACDSLDGVQDGLISNIAACNAVFNPSSATLNGTPLRCPGGADNGDTCLSDAQIAALNAYNTPITFGYALGSGETQYPGFNVYGADLGVLSPASPAEVEAGVTFLALGVSQPANPMPVAAPYMSVFWDQWIHFFVTRHSGYSSLAVDPANPGVWQSRIGQLAAIQDVNKTDLSAFETKGGKILMAHGMSDVLVSTRSTEQYYRRLQATMGIPAVEKFVRFYEIPGFGHAASNTFMPAWDSLSALENWVEKGVAPPAQLVMDLVGVPGRTRPLCEYPTWPRYNGSGNVNDATSFSCSQ